MEKSNIYTLTGDKGTTSLVGGKRVKKSNIRLEAYGTVDELNSWIGVLISKPDIPNDTRELLLSIQSRLFDIGAYLATESDANFTLPSLDATEKSLQEIEHAIDTIDSNLPKVHQFILPGGSEAAAIAHICRTVARRAERRIVELADNDAVDDIILKYINRLSDYFFILARHLNILTHNDEFFWQKG